MPDDVIIRGTAADLSLGLIRMVKLLHAVKQHAPRVHPAVDTMAYPLLFNLAQEPMRVSTLADCIHSDVSTVSRQVSGLVGHGLLEKVSDPHDGRAQLVTLSAEGHALITTIQQERVAWFRDLLADWSAEDTEEFARYVTRFGDTLEGLRERLTHRPETAGLAADDGGHQDKVADDQVAHDQVAHDSAAHDSATQDTHANHARTGGQ